MNIDQPITPQNTEAEVSILGAMLLSPNETFEQCSDLTEESFYQRSNKIIFNTISSMWNRQLPIDPITVTHELKSKGMLDEVGGAYHISKIAVAFPTAAHIEFYKETLEQNKKLRKLIEIGSSMVADGYSGEDASSLISKAEDKIYSLIDGKSKSQDNKLSNAFEEFQKKIEIRRSGERVTGLETGVPMFDRVFGGLQKSEYYVLAGRPSMGKSALADQIVMNVVLKDNPVLYIALEGSPEVVFSKITCKMADVSFTEFSKNTISLYDLSKLEKAGALLRTKPLIIVRPYSMEASEIRSTVRKYARKQEIKLLILDFIQKIASPKGWDERRTITDASHVIQDLCVQHNVPGLILAQLNRESEKEARPKMRHLKESGAVEEDANNVMLLWSEKETAEVPANELFPVICTIDKNKGGVRGTDEQLFFDRRLMKFKEPTIKTLY